MHGFREILLNWKPISQSSAHGEVLGYRIEYWMIELHEVLVPKTSVFNIDVLEPNRTAVIEKLQPFARYMIRILAFTEAGFGIWSKEQHGGVLNSTFTCFKKILYYRYKMAVKLQENL